MAIKRLAILTARKTAKADKKAAKVVPAVVKEAPSRPKKSPVTPNQLRARVRASLLRRSA